MPDRQSSIYENILVNKNTRISRFWVILGSHLKRAFVETRRSEMLLTLNAF